MTLLRQISRVSDWPSALLWQMSRGSDWPTALPQQQPPVLAALALLPEHPVLWHPHGPVVPEGPGPAMPGAVLTPQRGLATLEPAWGPPVSAPREAGNLHSPFGNQLQGSFGIRDQH